MFKMDQSNDKTLILNNNINEIEELDLCNFETIIIKDCDLSIKNLRKLIKKLLQSNVLKKLNLSGNKFGDKSCIIIGSLLFTNKTLENLDISDCNITKYGFIEILIKLISDKTLKLFNADICKYPVTKYEFIEILIKLIDNTTLKSINISNNPIEDIDKLKESSINFSKIEFIIK